MGLDITINSIGVEFDAYIKANDLQSKKEISLWKENDYHILNGFVNDLYDYYSICNAVKQAWETLKKSMAQRNWSKKV